MSPGMDRQGVCTLGCAGSPLQPSGEPGKGLSARPRSRCSAPLRATPRCPARPRALAPARVDTHAHPRVKGWLRGPQGVVMGDIGCVQILLSLGEPLTSSGLCCAPLPSPTSPGPPHQTELTPCPSRCVCSCVFRSSHVCDSHTLLLSPVRAPLHSQGWKIEGRVSYSKYQDHVLALRPQVL